ncbi:MAG TPA: hypothetical protein VM305_07500 [Candidatus Limnocylindrales bacterium]|nr:hypothetical protein [Candidatus Limnocylindrales bacterium]
MRLPFTRKQDKANAPTPPPRPLAPDSFSTHDMHLRLSYNVKAGDGVRMDAGSAQPAELPNLLAGIAISPVELVEPVTPEAQNAEPRLLDPDRALAWINARHQLSPIARHALFVLESLNAIDPAYETIAVALLSGDVDHEGMPRFDALVGGVISYWDETSGDLILRPVVAWGGDGARGDIDRNAQRVLTRLMGNILASQGAHGLYVTERAVAGGGARSCGHCGFPTLDRAARYCPKCGMRQGD